MEKDKRVMVTGGSGFVGRRLKTFKPDWIYVSSKECDLLDYNSTREFIEFVKPDSILHLAGRVGGIKDNFENQATFYYENTMMNTNLIHAAHECGVNRVLSSLSTCAFPDVAASYPFAEEDLFSGPPAVSNFSYGYSKRGLHVQTISYREQFGLNYSTFSPSNIYGIGDHFGKEASHFVAALVHRVSEWDGNKITFWGTGEPLRQQLYIDDLCKIIPILLSKHNSSDPLIVCPDENLSIKQMVKALIEQVNKKIKFDFNGRLDGQFRKDGSNFKLKKIIGNFNFTTFDVGVKKTYDWYMEKK